MNLLGTLQRKQTCVCVCVSLEVCRDFLVPVVIIIYVCLDVSVRCLSEFCKQGHLCSRAGASGCVCVCVYQCTDELWLFCQAPLLWFLLVSQHHTQPSPLATALIVLGLTDWRANGGWLQQNIGHEFPLLPSVTAVAHLQMWVILSLGVGVSFFFSLLPHFLPPSSFLLSLACIRTSPV